METLLFNIPKKPHIPYKNTSNTIQTQNIIQPPPKTDLPHFCLHQKDHFSKSFHLNTPPLIPLPNLKLQKLIIMPQGAKRGLKGRKEMREGRKAYAYGVELSLIENINA